MAQKIVRYLLEGNGTVPSFVKDGGHYPIGDEIVGLSVDEDRRHVPSSVCRMSKSSMRAWIKKIRTDADGNFLMGPNGSWTEESVDAELERFLERIGVPDYE